MVDAFVRYVDDGLDPRSRIFTVTPPVYNVQVFESAPPARPPQCIGAFIGAHPFPLAEREHEQKGLARCSFASARSR